MILREENAGATSSIPLRAGPRLTVAPFLLIAGGLLATWGCDDDGPLRLRVRVNAPAVPDQINMVRVWFAGSRRPYANAATCRPIYKDFNLAGRSDVPFYVEYLPGPVYRHTVFVRVEYFHDGIRVGLRDHPQAMPESGTIEIAIDYAEWCLSSPPPCLPDRQCLDDGCAIVWGASVFDDPVSVDPDAEYCDPSEADGG
jgi:hypothetical protein